MPSKKFFFYELLNARKEEKSSTDELPTRFAIEFFFVLQVTKSRKAKDFFCRRATYKGKYGKAKEALESARAGLSPQEGDVKKKRKEKDQGRQEGGSSKGKVPCALHQEFLFFWFTSIWVWKRPILVEVLAPAFFYEEAMCEGSSGNGLPYAAKAVP